MNVTQMPRMPVEYKRYMEAVGGHALQYWQLSAVGYILAPAKELRPETPTENAVAIVEEFIDSSSSV